MTQWISISEVKFVLNVILGIPGTHQNLFVLSVVMEKFKQMNYVMMDQKEDANKIVQALMMDINVLEEIQLVPLFVNLLLKLSKVQFKQVKLLGLWLLESNKFHRWEEQWVLDHNFSSQQMLIF